VVIGRNEGLRLQRSLESIFRQAGESIVVYVDSGSTDGSCDLAASLGAIVENLDTSLPFSAARARNAGFERLLTIKPDIQLVQFVDGDCQMQSQWLSTASGLLEQHPEFTVVCGRRREQNPKASIYNRLCDLEWNTPIGEATSCGGDAMMRVQALRQVGAFDPSVVAGEEPELCQRLRKAGGRVFRADAEMTLHDAAMTRFGQWWGRQIRSGYGAYDVVSRFGVASFRREVQSARLWGPFWGGAVLTAVIASIALALSGLAHLAFWTGIIALIGLGIGALQFLRITRHYRQRDCSMTDALAFAALTMVGKWGQAWGQWRYLCDRRSGKLARMIDYKASSIGTAVSP
jgi:glycosyltransferase involved in cell wall biosynthesis